VLTLLKDGGHQRIALNNRLEQLWRSAEKAIAKRAVMLLLWSN